MPPLSARADDTKQTDEIKRADETYVALFGDALVKADDKHRPEWQRGYAGDLRFGYHAEHHWGYELRVFYGKLKTKTVVAPTTQAPPPATEPLRTFAV